MKENTGKYPNCKKIPEVGDIIYMESHYFIDHPEEDFCGGKATINGVRDGISGGDPCIMISVVEDPYGGYNWDFLEPIQDELKLEYGDSYGYLYDCIL